MAKLFNTKTSGLGLIKEVVHSLGIAAISDAVPAVRGIITDVKQNGDAAIVKYTKQFDHVNVASISELKVSEREIDAAVNSCPKEVVAALELAAKRIEAYHQKQMPVSFDYID